MHIDNQDILRRFANGASSTFLFGSYARGDARHDSDVDILRVVAIPSHSWSDPPYGISNYTSSHLVSMAERGSLFIAHLIAEARALHDPANFLEMLRANYRPAPFDSVIADLRWAGKLLTHERAIFEAAPDRHMALASHLARTYIYACSVASGLNSFSMNILRYNRSLFPSGVPDLQSKSWSNFAEIRNWLVEKLHDKLQNDFETVEALIANAWGQSPLCVALGLRLLHGGEFLPPYEETDLAMGLR